MKRKQIILIYIIIIGTVISLFGQLKVTNTSCILNSDEKLIADEIEQEEFMSFIISFASESNFQKKRILFPLETILYNKSDEAIISRVNNIDYVYDSLLLVRDRYDVAFYNINAGIEPSHNFSEDNLSNDMVLTQWGLIGNKKIYYFQRLQGKWYLVKIEEKNNTDAFKDPSNNNQECFSVFIVNFNNNPQFQLDRIQFPLSYKYYESDEEVIKKLHKSNYKTESILVGNISNKLSFFYINAGKESINSFDFDNMSNNMVVYVWGMTDYYSIYFFKRINGKWFLNQIESSDPLE